MDDCHNEEQRSADLKILFKGKKQNRIWLLHVKPSVRIFFSHYNLQVQILFWVRGKVFSKVWFFPSIVKYWTSRIKGEFCTLHCALKSRKSATWKGFSSKAKVNICMRKKYILLTFFYVHHVKNIVFNFIIFPYNKNQNLLSDYHNMTQNLINRHGKRRIMIWILEKGKTHTVF